MHPRAKKPAVTPARRLRIGVLGCGQIAQDAHLAACRRGRNTELYAICDVAEDLRDRMAVLHQPRACYADYDAMLADPAVEAVIVAVADAFHVAAAEKAVRAGKPVLVEKPLGVSIAECEGLVRLARRRGVTVQVGNMKRFDPGLVFARRFLAEEAGAVLSLKAWYCDSIYRYVETANLQAIPVRSVRARRPAGDPRANRRAYYLLGHGSHLVDTARFLGGDMIAVDARLTEKFGAFCWMIAAEFAGGFFGQLDLTIPIQAPWREGFEVQAEHGSVCGRTENPWYRRASEVECFSARDGVYRRPHGADADFFRLQVEGFAATVLEGVPQWGATAAEGAAAVRALAAISESCRRQRPVRLADAEGGPA